MLQTPTSNLTSPGSSPDKELQTGLPATVSGALIGVQVCLLRPEPTVLQAYTQVRREGERELGAVLLGITNELLTFDFKETFVDPFAVRPFPAA